jgi:LCP family protein required for cell wall assembly
VLADPNDQFINFLVVGSDSRANADPNDPDFANVGGEGDVQGRRSDTLIVVNVEKSTGIISLMSVPRDLWVAIGDSENTERINVAYREGAAVVVRTINRALGIPIHHYLEIDFQGFKQLVDAVGGVTVCVEHPTRDRKTGLYIRPGCKNLDGVDSLAYARSRSFEEKYSPGTRVERINPSTNMLLAGTVMDIPFPTDVSDPDAKIFYTILFDNGTSASVPLSDMSSILPAPPVDVATCNSQDSLLPPFFSKRSS